MKYNSLARVLSSIPVVLVFIYFSPFIGFCLLVLRYFTYSRKKLSGASVLIVVGFIILIPKGLSYIFDWFKGDVGSIPYYDSIINSEIYNVKFINYSKNLFIVGIIYMIIFSIVDKISSKISTSIGSYFKGSYEKDIEISEKNDLKMKEKTEKAKHTRVVRCPYCGADNMLTSEVGTCKYCRKKIK